MNPNCTCAIDREEICVACRAPQFKIRPRSVVNPPFDFAFFVCVIGLVITYVSAPVEYLATAVVSLTWGSLLSWLYLNPEEKPGFHDNLPETINIEGF
jgi:hypothetical protein